ncbi:unnamed protein product [Darwinula stevensoni]|uniref:TROVE domain-containing protein n=1 Tax=Darwinula stevensoni TaxID=69355 RepID=A0A7R8X5K5_9CRUS|nr:unnamed protein product [Darwinula stevensoni]CAG0884774.1 unnamed protein product [Darwinula stevensoni]
MNQEYMNSFISLMPGKMFGHGDLGLPAGLQNHILQELKDKWQNELHFKSVQVKPLSLENKLAKSTFKVSYDFNTLSSVIPKTNRFLAGSEDTQKIVVKYEGVPLKDVVVDEDLSVPLEYESEKNMSSKKFSYNDEDMYQELRLQLDLGSHEVTREEVPLPRDVSESQRRTREILMKWELLNAVCCSLIESPNLMEVDDPTRKVLSMYSGMILKYDPEFILKAALYAREELFLRSTANFLLSYSAFMPECRPYLKKYFASCIRTPADWIQVPQFYMVFHEQCEISFLPAALRKCLVSKFSEFDAYQLAKYKGRYTAKKTTRKLNAGNLTKSHDEEDQEELYIGDLFSPSDEEEEVDEDSEDDEETGARSQEKQKRSKKEMLVKRRFNLKRLVRCLHISQPPELVMSLLGKRYPESVKRFMQSGLPGHFDEQMSGKRMKLSVPETWETQVSLKGNKASIWEALIDAKKLPFVAMLRNIRNLLLAGISKNHHQKVLFTLSSMKAVTRSRLPAFRFFTAYEVLDELEKNVKEAKSSGIQEQQERRKKIPAWARIKEERKQKKYLSLATEEHAKLLERYRQALDKAVKWATLYNIPHIDGSTVILVDIGPSMNASCLSAKGLGKPRTVREVGLLLGIMCAHVCEDSRLIAYGCSTYSHVPLKQGIILSNVEDALLLQRASVGGTDQIMSGSEDVVVLEVVKMTSVVVVVVLPSQLSSSSDVGTGKNAADGIVFNDVLVMEMSISGLVIPAKAPVERLRICRPTRTSLLSLGLNAIQEKSTHPNKCVLRELPDLVVSKIELLDLRGVLKCCLSDSLNFIEISDSCDVHYLALTCDICKDGSEAHKDAIGVKNEMAQVPYISQGIGGEFSKKVNLQESLRLDEANCVGAEVEDLQVWLMFEGFLWYQI